MRENMLVRNILVETMTYELITVTSIQKDWMRNRPH